MASPGHASQHRRYGHRPDERRLIRPCQRLSIPSGEAGVALLMSALPAAVGGRREGPSPSLPAVAVMPTGVPEILEQRLIAALRPDSPVPVEVAAVLATSGSTGTPRGVLLPASAVRAAASSFAQLTGAGAGPTGAGARQPRPGHRWVAALPLHSVGGFMVVVRAWLGGSAPVALAGLGGAGSFSVEALARATDQADTLSASDGRPLAVSLVPAMLAVLDGAEGLDLLHRFDVVLVGGAAAPGRLVARLREAGVRVVTSYGMTETCGGVVFDGLPAPGVTLVDEAGGRLSIVSEQVALGYRDGPVFPEVDPVTTKGRRRFRTSDLVEFDEAHRMHVRGRVDDVVQVGGVSVALSEVRERLLLRDDLIRDAQVVAVADPDWGARIVAFVVPSRPHAPSEAWAATLADGIVGALGRAARPRDIRILAAIPELPGGKPDLPGLRALAEAPRIPD